LRIVVLAISNIYKSVLVWLLILAAGINASAAYAQKAAPVTVTPETLRPQLNYEMFQVNIPHSEGLVPPAGLERLSITLNSVSVEGGFASMTSQTDVITARLSGQQRSVAQIYAAASDIESAYARAGYVLARVTVPPQDLVDGGTLRLIIVDGFVEDIDVSHIPVAVRVAVAARTAALKGHTHVLLGDIEQPLLIADEVPGLSMRSTLERGQQRGGTRIILEGSHRLIAGSVGVNNQFDPSLGRWGANAQLAINSALGLGEDIYGFFSTGSDITKIFSDDARVRVLGGGIALPIGNGRLTLNPEVTFARTAPAPAPGAPDSVGTLRRLTFRANIILKRTRRNALNLDVVVEQLEAINNLPQFAFTLSHDRYLSMRIGINHAQKRGRGLSTFLSAQLSKGLGDFGAISPTEAAASGIGYSRIGAGNDFTKLNLQANANWTFGNRVDLSLIAKAQTTFAKAIFRSEQFSLEGRDAVSAYVGGETSVDEGAVARAELSTQIDTGNSMLFSSLSPYLFAAGGIGRINQPTIAEPTSLTTAAIGTGARFSMFGDKLSFLLEYARGFSDVETLDGADRINFSTIFRF
jgi:hemolysin activation/secretion protein